jgi:diaminohydroxyphosphoribosylaminopyrimidine deaminase / 5-amino-6-(5-phosphoribosylamino)uracil reductase
MPEQYMAQALSLAASVKGAVGPNPRVGCVIVAADGSVVGRGAHQGTGTAHAEVVALAEAGDAARGATAYVTLEPCDHHGLTPPCAQALVAAGIGKVHYAVADPTPAAGGARTLREHGIAAEQGPLTEQAQAFLEPWLFAVTTGRPFVTYKVASTLDGYIAAADGTSRWITGPEARARSHELRAQVDAIAVGSGTYRADRPELTVRGIDVVRQPQRFVLGDVQVAEGFATIPGHDPRAALAHMYDAGVRHLLLEGGATVGAAFLTAGLVDDLVWFAAPKLLGAGTRAVADLGVAAIGQALEWHITGIEQVGDDVLIRSRRR